MKPLLPIFLLFLISSCASLDTSRIAPGYIQAFNAMKQLITGVEVNISPETIEKIPYASMLVRIGNGPAALMILESQINENYTWVSADGVYLVINSGKIIKTQGLNNNLNEKLEPSSKWNDYSYGTQEYISYNSFSLPTLDNLKVISTYHQKGINETQLMFGIKNLILIEEDIIAEEVAWRETNKYWLDDSDFVWKSIQYISPRLPAIYFEVTKKPL